MSRKTNIARNIITFEADDVVMKILKNAEKRGRGEKTKLINEAILQNGDSSTLSILKREIEIAKAKYHYVLQNVRSKKK